MKIQYPWFPRELNPNWSGHYMQKAKYKSMYREICKLQTMDAMISQKNEGDYTEMIFTFYKPNKRHSDLDNMLSSSKALVDGLCDALGMNDKMFTKITIIKAEEIGGYINVELK